MTGPTPQRCLAAADQLLRGVGMLGAVAVTAGWWPRACACLIRLALEGGIDAYWRRVKPTVAACQQGRAKHLMLRSRLGPGAETPGGSRSPGPPSPPPRTTTATSWPLRGRSYVACTPR
ncbi:hypothetical protein JNW88_14115 [Micromonospora sp. ATA32]|nr:hypothetical protein [Micromonospora sp. ATA32]